MADRPADSEDLARLYREAIRQHAADPVGYRQAIAATHRHEEHNLLCGDRIEIRLRVAAGRVEAAAFDGEACAICMASASLLCRLAPGRTVPGLRELNEALHQAFNRRTEFIREKENTTDGIPQEEPSRKNPLLPESQAPVARTELPEELHPLLGVRRYPSRIRCATLPWTAAARALPG